MKGFALYKTPPFPLAAVPLNAEDGIPGTKSSSYRSPGASDAADVGV